MTLLKVQCQALIVLAVCLFAQLVVAAGLAPEPRTSTIHVRFIAREQPIARTSFGDNWDSYIAELQHKNGERELIRLSYRFLYYEPQMPQSFLDYSYVYGFRALRSEECSATIAAATRKYAFGTAGRIEIHKTALHYASDAPQLDEGSQAVLPCYVVRPSGHFSSKRRVGEALEVSSVVKIEAATAPELNKTQ